MEDTQLDGTSTEIKDPKAVLDALDRAKKDAKQFRLEKEGLESQLSELKTTIVKVQSKYKTDRIIKQLSDMGFQNPDKVLKYLKIEEIQFDEELELEGIDEQIAMLKSDFPELFDPKLLVAGKADSAQSTPVDKRLSTSEMQAKLVLGR